MQDNVRRLKAAGVRIGVGTDAGIEGVYHGPGTLREIWWLTKLGFTPAEALGLLTNWLLLSCVAGVVSVNLTVERVVVMLVLPSPTRN